MPSTTTSPSTQSQQTASPVVQGLNQFLADNYALLANTQFAHWNVEGPGFFALHQAFENQYNELFTAVDDIAERIRALDAYPQGGLTHFARASGIEEFTSPRSAKDYVAGLAEGHEKAIADGSTLRDQAEEAGDLQTQDLLIERLQWHQKTLWMLRAYLK